MVMDEMDILEWTDMIDAEYIQESFEMHSKEGAGSRIVRVKWWYYAGLAACLAISLLSGALLAVGGFAGGSEVSQDENLATAISQNGRIILAVLFLALVIAGAFLFLIIREKRGKNNRSH